MGEMTSPVFFSLPSTPLGLTILLPKIICQTERSRSDKSRVDVANHESK